MENYEQSMDELIDFGEVTEVTHGAVRGDLDTLGLPEHQIGIADD